MTFSDKLLSTRRSCLCRHVQRRGLTSKTVEFSK